MLGHRVLHFAVVAGEERRCAHRDARVTAHQKATVAVVHSIVVVVYHLFERGEPYKELGGDYFIERQEKDACQRRLVKQTRTHGLRHRAD